MDFANNTIGAPSKIKENFQVRVLKLKGPDPHSVSILVGVPESVDAGTSKKLSYDIIPRVNFLANFKYSLMSC